MIKIVFLGTSATIPTRERNLTAIFLMYKDTRILFDCGEGTQRQLMDKNLKFYRINHIFITHWHADHFAGLLGLIQTMSLEGRTAPLYVYGPKDSEFYIQKLLTIGYFYRRFDIVIKDLNDNDEIKFDDFTIKAFKVNHGIPSLGFVFQEKDKIRANMKKAAKFGLKTSPLIGKLKKGETIEFKGKKIRPEDILEKTLGTKIVYTGDTKYCANVLKHAKDADLLIHDSTFLSTREDLEFIGHSSAKDAASIAKKANAKQLVLTHISRRYQEGAKEKDILLLKEAKTIFKNTVLARDFLEMRVK